MSWNLTSEDAQNVDQMYGSLAAGFSKAAEAMGKLSDSEVARVREVLHEHGPHEPDIAMNALMTMANERLRRIALRDAKHVLVHVEEQRGGWFLAVSVGGESLDIRAGQTHDQAMISGEALQSFLNMAGIEADLTYSIPQIQSADTADLPF